MNSRYGVIMLTMIIGLSFGNAAIAKKYNEQKKPSFPTGCANTGYRFDLYNLIVTPSSKKSKQTIYFIHNMSERPINLLEAEEENKPYIMHTNGTVNPNLWSVLAATKKEIKFICTNTNPHTKLQTVINCKKGISVCEFSQANFGPNHRGTYWMTSNQSQKEAVNMVRDYGVLLNAKISE